MKGSESKGKIISQATEILKETYRDIEKLKGDFSELLEETDASFSQVGGYSYSPNRLYLKRNHLYLFSDRQYDEDGQFDPKIHKTEKVVGLVIIFDEGEGGIDRVNLEDEPELWCYYIDRKKIETYYDHHGLRFWLDTENREYFEDKKLEVGGKVHKFRWESDDSEEIEEGKCIGYPLTEIEGRDKIKELIIDKLFP